MRVSLLLSALFLILMPAVFPTVLLTGFGPFGEHEQNVSYQGIRDLDGTTLKGRTITVLRLPVVWEASRTLLLGALDGQAPRAAVSAGIDASARADVVVEAYARNRTSPIADTLGRLPPDHGAVVPGAEEIIPSALSADTAVYALQSVGIDAASGTDPGGYLCGWVYYLLLHTLGDEAPAVFLHFRPETPPETVSRTVLIIAELLLETEADRQVLSVLPPVCPSDT